MGCFYASSAFYGIANKRINHKMYVKDSENIRISLQFVYIDILHDVCMVSLVDVRTLTYGFAFGSCVPSVTCELAGDRDIFLW